MASLSPSIIVFLAERCHHKHKWADNLSPPDGHRVEYPHRFIQTPLSDIYLFSPALTMGTPQTSSNTQPYTLSSRSPYQQYHNPTMAINPAFVHSFPPSRQNAQSPPQTLAPYVLHAQSPPVETVSPASFYQQSPPSTSATPPSNTPTSTSNKLTPQARQEKFNSTIKPLLQPNQFTGAGAVSDLADKIIALDIADIEGPLRLEILTKIRDNAGNHYFRAWVENEDAMDITREWLKAAAKGDDQLVETIMPLLHVRRSFMVSMMDVLNAVTAR